MTTPAIFRILGEDATSAAFRSVLGSSEKSAKAMERIFRGAFGNIGAAAGGIGKHLTAVRMLLGVGGIAGAAGIATVAFTALWRKVKESREEHERINDLAERLDLPASEVRDYSDAWAQLAISLRDAERGFGRLSDGQAQAFGSLGLDPVVSSLKKAVTRIAAATGTKSEKIDVLRILGFPSYQEAEKALEKELARLNETVRQRSKDNIRKTRAELEGVEFGKEDVGFLLRSGAILPPEERKQLEQEFDALLKQMENERKESLKVMEEAEREASQKRKELWELERAEFFNIQKGMQDDLSDVLEAGNDRIALSFDLAVDEILATTQDMLKPVENEFSVFADQAARNMQTAFADFLFDPFDDGLKGMLKGFIDTIRRMVAEVAAAKIFSGLGGTSGIGAALGGLLGFAGGGSFKVGGSGGTDSSLVAFKATPGEMVDVRTPGQSRGAQVVQHISIDARGSSVESVKLLQATIPSIIRQAVQQSRMAVMDDISRGVRA